LNITNNTISYLNKKGLDISMQKRNKSVQNRAQGTIEYLVIIAVIVVIGLVVAAMSTNFLGDSQQINNANANIKGQIGTGGISVIETIADSQGNAFITLKNNSGENLTVTRISTANADNAYDKQMLNLTQNTFYITDINTYCPCTTGQTKNTCTFYITTTDKYGNTQTETLTNVTVNCITEATPRDPTKIVGLGTGTLADPFIINNCNELQEIQNDLDGNYALGADINCYNYSFTPITSFTGSLNGRSNEIQDLSISLTESNYVGIFSATTETSSLSNIQVTDGDIEGYTYVGGLASTNAGTISNCSFSGTVKGYSTVGGIVGVNESTGTITLSSTSGTISDIGTSSGVYGGIAGTSAGTISYSNSSATVSSSFEGGGIASQNTGTISFSYASGSIAGGNTSTGGISAQSSGTISNSYFTGSVVGQTAGGIAGTNTGTVSNCYSSGAITGGGTTPRVGGISGTSATGIENSFAVGAISGGAFMAGLVGNTSTITNSYWDTTLTGQEYCYRTASTGCTPTADAASSYYGASGIPFNSETGLGWSTDIWQANASGYPTLK